MPGPGRGDRSLWCHRYGVMRVNACPCARECLTSYPQIHVVTRISIPLSNLYSRLFLIITHCLCATPFLQIRHSCISDHFTAKEFSRPRTSWYCTGANIYHQNLLRNFSLPVTYTFSSPLSNHGNGRTNSHYKNGCITLLSTLRFSLVNQTPP